LPKLEELDQRPTILLGNSVGALNIGYLAANAGTPAEEMIKAGQKIWGGLTYTDIFAHVLSLSSLRRAFLFAGEALGIRRARLPSLLEPAHLKATIERSVDFDRLSENVARGPLQAAGVVATSGLTGRSVVFHQGGSPAQDRWRLIDYVATELEVDHIRASTAIPAVFPAVHVMNPKLARGWYFDGGTRLNVPIKPALALGAKRVVVIGLSSLSPGPSQLAGPSQPDAFAGIARVVQGLLGDQLIQDIHTLARVNQQVQASGGVLSAAGGEHELVPYIVIAPQEADTVEQLAFEVFGRRYARLRDLFRRPDIGMLGRAIGALADVQNTTLLSMLMFDSEFIAALIELGANDARRWLGETHDGPEPIWQLKRL
jgi:NTE family protein